MPRKATRKQLSTTVTAEQHAIAQRLAGEEGLNAYLRRLVAEDAARRGIRWANNLPDRGQYERNPNMISKGDTIRVKPFVWSQHLSKGTIIQPARDHQHHGYHAVTVCEVFPDEVANDAMVEVYVGKFGDVDTVPLSACEKIS